MDNFCVFLTNQLEQERQYTAVASSCLPQQIHGDLIVIPHAYSTEEDTFKEDLLRLCNANIQVKEALETGTSVTIEYTLTEINNIIPRKRVRSDAYVRFQRFLKTKGITLIINSRKRQKTNA
ncbi:MAG: hypothetical protein KBT34_08255 [Prevotella sp.]|nr:hypothetical protein [Candidatus Prevotella equi]